MIPPRSDLRVHVAESRPHETFPAAALEHGIVHLGGSSLAELARPGHRVTIAFTDATRSSPDAGMIALLLDELSAAGVRRDNVTLLCATGLHRPMTAAERAAKLGPLADAGFAIVSHDALDPDGLVDLGEIDGVPVVVNRRCVEADLLIATGVVEPHQYAGYSGGYKTIVIGCGGERTIEATHGPGMLDRSGVRLGEIASNPFQTFLRAAGERIGLDRIVNVLTNEHGEIIAAAAGEPAAVHDHLASRGRAVFQTEVERPAQIAIAGVAPAKAVNLYQASRAATYLARAERTPLLSGAPIILPAAIPEGAGEGTGERRFFEILSHASSPAALIDELRRSGFPAGAQRAYVLAQVLAEHPVIVVGARHPEIVRACHMFAAEDIEAGLDIAIAIARRTFRVAAPTPLDLLAVPNALVTLPRLG